MDTLYVATGLLLIVVPILFNVFFALLSKKFEYPDILRQPAKDIFAKFTAGGTSLKLLWLGFAYTSIAFIPLAVFSGQVFDASPLALFTVIVGVVAAIVQFLGLIRWPFLVPILARRYAAEKANRPAIELTFDVFNRYLGVAVGEHLGYFFTGLWTILTSIMILQSTILAPAFGWVGLVSGILIMIGSLEFVGKHEEHGWELIGKLVAIAYILWSLWLITCGIGLLFAA